MQVLASRPTLGPISFTLLLLTAGCSGSQAGGGTNTGKDTGGNAASTGGGAAGSGGTTSATDTGGATSSGGTTNAGGAIVTGGRASAGGGTTGGSTQGSGGGTTGTGGATSSGGATSAGGAIVTGGRASTGGSTTGTSMTGTGGSTQGSGGGTTGTGGSTKGTGGSGGTTGGATGTGGAGATTGGATGTGGAGGVTGTGGGSALLRGDIGMNVGATVYWATASYDFPFANMFLHSTPNSAASGFNAQGYPTGTSASTVVWADTVGMDGTYRFSCNGKVTLSMSGGTVSNQQYSNGVTTATVVVSSAAKSTGIVDFSGMTANPSGSITNVKLMRPVTEGSATSYDPSVTFIDSYIQLIQKVSVFRTMDMTATNGNAQVNWSDRVTPAWFSQYNEASGYAWEGRGIAWEYVVELANRTGRDPWICVPQAATDDYVTQLATLFKNGLAADRKLYVEYSNEVWNTGNPFPGNWNHDQAVAEQKAGVPYDFDGDTNDWDWAWRRTAKRGAEISQIFRTVFGDAQMMTRVRPLLESQLGYNQGPLLQALQFMQGYLATLAPNPHPVSYYFYGGGGSSYYGGNASTVDAVLNGIPGTGWDQDIYNDVKYLSPFGLKRVAYEGGPGFDDLSAAEISAWSDPRMSDKVTAAHDIFTQNGGDLSVYFSSDGDQRWRWPGMTNATYFTSPKILGIDELNTLTQAPFSKGTLVPAQISSTPYDCPETWLTGNGDPTNAKQNGWWGYTIRSSASKSYTIGVSAGATNANGKLKLSVDGTDLGVLSIPNTGSTTNFSMSNTFSVTLDPGKHGILIQCTSGPGLHVDKIVVQ